MLRSEFQLSERREPKKKGGIPTKRLNLIVILAFITVVLNGTATAGGFFGPPQSVSREGGGLHTGIGYNYHEDKYEDATDHVIRQNQVYSHLGYGTRNWEIFGRIGVSDLKISDAFRSTQAATFTFKNDFEDHWNFFGTVGAKGFYSFNKIFGIGAFMQGSYFFSDFIDQVSGIQNGAPFAIQLKVKNLWDVNFGLGLQAKVPKDIKIYIGPYIYYSEAKISPSAKIPGLEFSAEDIRVRNKAIAGGYAGVDVPLARGFHLNVEGQYAERFSGGVMVTYSY